MNKLKEKFGFEFWQKFGKAQVVIAVMPAAGLMISLGKTVAMINPNVAPLVITGGFLEQIGWGVIGNLHILFALAIGGSWAKERAGGAFAAGLAFILINRLTGSIFGVTSDILADKAATVHTVFGQSIKVSDYFISVLEAPALNMGVFVGIISGFIGATAYNKYYNFRKLPEALSFFNGKRLRTIRSYSSFSYRSYRPCYRMASYPIRNQRLRYVDCQLKRNCSNLGTVLVRYFGTLLLPFGLHHMIDYPN